jgi:hypothetical protein
MPWNSLLTTRRQLLAASAATGAVSLLLGQFAAATETATIRPFHVSFPEQALVDLRQRIEATKRSRMQPKASSWRRFRSSFATEGRITIGENARRS